MLQAIYLFCQNTYEIRLGLARPLVASLQLDDMLETNGKSSANVVEGRGGVREDERDGEVDEDEDDNDCKKKLRTRTEEDEDEEDEGRGSSSAGYYGSSGLVGLIGDVARRGSGDCGGGVDGVVGGDIDEDNNLHFQTTSLSKSYLASVTQRGGNEGVNESRRRPISAIPKHLRQLGSASSSTYASNTTPSFGNHADTDGASLAPKTASTTSSSSPSSSPISGFRVVTSGCYDNVASPMGSSTSPRSTRSDVSVSVDESNAGDKDSGVGTTRSSTGSRWVKSFHIVDEKYCYAPIAEEKRS